MLKLRKSLKSIFLIMVMTVVVSVVSTSTAHANSIVDRNRDGQITSPEDYEITATLLQETEIELSIDITIDPNDPESDAPFQEPYTRVRTVKLVDGNVDETWRYERYVDWWANDNAERDQRCKWQIHVPNAGKDGISAIVENGQFEAEIELLFLGDQYDPDDATREHSNNSFTNYGACRPDVATQEYIASDIKIDVQVSSEEVANRSFNWIDPQTIFNGALAAVSSEDLASDKAYVQNSANELEFRQRDNGPCESFIRIDPDDKTKGTLFNEKKDGNECVQEEDPQDIVIGNLENIDEDPDNDTGINGGGTGGTGSGTSEPTCESENPGVGFILCPAARNGLKVLNGVFGWLTNIMNISFAEDQEDVLRSIWNGFRAIANIGFAITFMIVIYSAASGGLFSAYDIKRILPRLVIGAIAVQLSLPLSLWLIDLFNLIGDQSANLILSPLGGDQNDTLSFVAERSPLGDGGIVETLAAGGLGILIVIMLIVASFFAFTGVLLMSIVFLLRNMFILILVVVSPVAVVFWILPSTEKFFRRWSGMFMQLLMLYPIAAIFLASGRLLAAIWIGTGSTSDNPIDNGNISNVIIGTIAMFAPYFIAPKMFSFAGQAVNGIVSGVQGAQNTAKSRSAQAKDSRTGTNLRSGSVLKGNNKFSRGFNRATRATTNPKTILPTKGGQRARAAAARTTLKMGEEEFSDQVAIQKQERARIRAKTGGSREDMDKAEIKYLSRLAKNGTASEQRAAVKTLVDVHGSSGVAIAAVGSSMAGLRNSGVASDLAIADQIVEDNRGSLSKVPQLVKDNNSSTVKGLGSGIHNVTGGSLDNLLAADVDTIDPKTGKTIQSAQSAVIDKFIKDGSNPATRGNIKKKDAENVLSSLLESHKRKGTNPTADTRVGDLNTLISHL